MCRKKTLSRPTSWRTWRAASRNGSDSMSPTVPPISVITTSARLPSASGSAIARTRLLISSVMCGMTWTVSPRYSPRRSLAITDLGDHHVGPVTVGVGFGHREDATLDLVGDVRDDLDGVAEILALALHGNHRSR